MKNRTEQEKGRRLGLIKNFSLYSSSTLVATVLVLIQNIVLRKTLHTENFGIFSLLTVILMHLSSIHFGLVLAAEREIPYLLGKNDIKRLKKVEGVTFTSALGITGIAVILMGSCTFFIGPYVSEPFLKGFRLILLILIFQEIVIFYETLARGHNDFSLISKRILLTALLNLTFSTSLGYFYGLSGALSGILLSTVIVSLFYHFTDTNDVKLQFYRDIFYSLLKIGAPILAISLVYTLLTSIDTIFVYAIMGAKVTGHYSLAPLLFSISMLVPRMMGIIMYPNILSQYGATEDRGLILKKIRKTLEITVTASSLIIGIIFLSLTPVISLLLPEYTPGIEPARIILISSFFLGILPLQGYFLIATKHLRAYFIINAFSLLVAILGNLLVIHFTPSMEGIAVATGIGYLINGSLIYVYINKQFVRIRNAVFDVFRLYSTYFYALTAMIISKVITERIEVIPELSSILLFFLFSIPIIYNLQRKFGIYTDLYGFIRNMLKGFE